MRRLLWLLLFTPLIHATDPATGEAPTPKNRFDWLAWTDLLYQDQSPSVDDFLGVGHVYLGLDYHFSPHWRVLVVGEYEGEQDEGNKEGDETFIDRIFLEYAWSAGNRLRFGRVNTPAGIWKPMHWEITVDTIYKPIMEENQYLPIKSDGLEWLGSKVTRGGIWNYTLIAASIDEDVSNNVSLDDATALGGDLNYTWGERIRGGLSFYSYSNLGRHGASVVGWLPYYEHWFLDKRLLWRSELLLLNRAAADNVDTGYTKLKFKLDNQNYLNLRVDLGESEEDGLNRKENIYSLTWGSRFGRKLRLKTEFARIQPREGGGQYVNRWGAWVGYIIK